MDELIEQLDQALEDTKDFNQFGHLFSDDSGTQTLARIRKTVGKIAMLVKISAIKKIVHPKSSPIKDDRDTGSFVSIRPCAEEYKGKTYLGIYIGDVGLGSRVSIEDDAIRCEWSGFNPGILIPSIGKVVYGCESWWGFISSEEELKDITDLDIDNIWYVKAMKKMTESGA